MISSQSLSGFLFNRSENHLVWMSSPDRAKSVTREFSISHSKDPPPRESATSLLLQRGIDSEQFKQPVSLFLLQIRRRHMTRLGRLATWRRVKRYRWYLPLTSCGTCKIASCPWCIVVWGLRYFNHKLGIVWKLLEGMNWGTFMYFCSFGWREDSLTFGGEQGLVFYVLYVSIFSPDLYLLLLLFYSIIFI